MAYVHHKRNLAVRQLKFGAFLISSSSMKTQLLGNSDQEPKLSQNLLLARRVKTVTDRRDVSAGALAAACTLHNPAVTGAKIGARNAAG